MICSAGKAWAEEEITKDISNIEVMSFNFQATNTNKHDALLHIVQWQTVYYIKLALAKQQEKTKRKNKGNQ